jgi:hypothetical protein
MTRRTPVRLLSGVAFLVLLSSCAGSGAGVDPAADAAAAASASTTDRSPDSSTAGTTAGGSGGATGGGSGDATGGGQQGNPGGPGADPADGGGSGGGPAQGNPGAPGDVAVFEEENAPYSALVGDAATKCADGACTLKEPPIILDGHVDRVEGGVGECTIALKTDILYDPPAQGGRFPKGATVRAQVHCADVETPVEEPGGDSPAGGDPAGQNPASPDAGNPAGGTTSGGTPPATGSQPQG